MARLPIVLVHGYSADAATFAPWRKALAARGYDPANIHSCSYRSLTNEVTIRDVAEAFDRALRIQAGLSAEEPFDAIVHSTGMLVLRAWLVGYAARKARLRHLVALAPASFGSPLAHKGRSWLGALFKGNRQLGPDFLEAGDRILDGLELGSRFTWDLAHQDLLAEEAFYGPTRRTPYVFVLCGNTSYTGFARLADNEAGCDGVVRWAGAPLNTRKICLDLTREPARDGTRERVSVADWRNVDIPLVAVDGKNHGTILSDPGDDLVARVDSALRVSDAKSFAAWIAGAESETARARSRMGSWQQFVVHAVDERGDPISDFNVRLCARSGASGSRSTDVREFDMDVHSYSGDSSYRCFHVDLGKLDVAAMRNLSIRVMASSGSRLVGYHGYGTTGGAAAGSTPSAGVIAELDLSSLLNDAKVRLFYPFTTTLIEITLNREPLPLSGRNELCWF